MIGDPLIPKTIVITTVAMMKTTTQDTRSKGSKLGAILRVTSGNFLGQFDFFLFGFYATYIRADRDAVDHGRGHGLDRLGSGPA